MNTLASPSSLRRPNIRQPLVSNAVFGTSLLVATEVMFFLGLISAYSVIEASAVVFSPPQGVTLPFYQTAFNTCVLLASGLTMFLSARAARLGYPDLARKYLLVSALGGLFFVSVQGYEWIRLLEFGMTMRSGVYSACFFLLIGSHGIHAAGAVIVMLAFYRKACRKPLGADVFQALQIFWLFVVGIWPVLYGMVYF